MRAAPGRPGHLWDDIRRVAAALHRQPDGQALLARLSGRLGQVERQAAVAGNRPRVVSIEWLQPVMLGGTWMPELITAAGGTPLGVTAGAPALDLAALERLELLPRALPWAAWPAVRAGQVYVADGNATSTAPVPGSSTRPSSWPPASTPGGSPST